MFVNKRSPVSVVYCALRTDQFIYIYIYTWDIKCRHPTMSLAHFSIYSLWAGGGGRHILISYIVEGKGGGFSFLTTGSMRKSRSASFSNNEQHFSPTMVSFGIKRTINERFKSFREIKKTIVFKNFKKRFKIVWTNLKKRSVSYWTNKFLK